MINGNLFTYNNSLADAAFENDHAVQHKFKQFLSQNILDDRSLVIFTDARSPMAIALKDYQIKSQIKFKMYGFWQDGIYSGIHSRYAVEYKKNPGLTTWGRRYEYFLSTIYDMNLFISDNQRVRFSNTVKQSAKSYSNLSKCALPTTYLNSIIRSKARVREKENIVVYNRLDGNAYVDNIFNFIRKDLPEYEFIEIDNNDKLNHELYIDLLSRAKCILSTDLFDHSLYNMFEAMLLGCIPLMPKTSIYLDVFKNLPKDLFYDYDILIKPALTYMRKRSQTIGKIREIMVKYEKFDLTESIKAIEDEHFNSNDLIKILSKNE